MKKTQAERAQSYFEHNSKVTKLFGTSDDNLFERNQDALAHSTTLEDKNIDVFTAPGGDVEQTADPKSEFLQLSVKKIEAALPEMTDVDALKAYLDEETSQEPPRTTAVQAIEARIAFLTNPA